MSHAPGIGHRRDENESEIIDALGAEGCAVQQLSGPGIPDLLVWVPRAESYELCEVKMPGRGLTPAQTKWWAAWAAKGGRKPWVLTSAYDARWMVRCLVERGARDDLDTPASAGRRSDGSL